MLKNAGAHYVKVDGQLYVLGDDAFKFASLFHQECFATNVSGCFESKRTSFKSYGSRTNKGCSRKT